MVEGCGSCGDECGWGKCEVTLDLRRVFEVVFKGRAPFGLVFEETRLSMGVGKCSAVGEGNGLPGFSSRDSAQCSSTNRMTTMAVRQHNIPSSTHTRLSHHGIRQGEGSVLSLRDDAINSLFSDMI